MKAKKLLVVSLILGLFAAVSVYRYLGELERKANLEANLVPVLVPKTDIAPGTRLDASMFSVVEIPADFRHSVDLASREEVQGRYAAERLLAGEQVLATRLVSAQDSNALSYKVSPGHRALTVPVNTVSGVAGYIMPGDRVDVVATFPLDNLERDEAVATVVAPGIRVLAVGPHTAAQQGKEQLAVDSVTMDVPAEYVGAIFLALDRGTLRLVLRPVEDGTGKSVTTHTLTRLLQQ